MLLVLFDIFLGLNHAEHACVFALITLTAVKFCIGSGNVNQQHMAVFVSPWRLMCNTLTRRGLCVGCFRVSTTVFVCPWQLLCNTLTTRGLCVGCFGVRTTVFVIQWQLMCNTLTRRGLCVGCFRVGHCEKATELQAVETLLISDELFRYVHGCVCVWVGACTCVHACMCV